MQRNCLITGVAGFIGFHSARLFLEKGLNVVGLDAILPYYEIDLKKTNISELLNYPNFKFIQENILDFDFSTIDIPIHYILHLAASPGVRYSSKRTQEYIDNNITASIKILEFAATQPLEKLIMASTSSIYDDKNELPFLESSNLKPKAVYGISKLGMEKISQIYKEEYNLPLQILRYFSAYGPRQRPDMGIYKFMRKIIDRKTIEIYGNGEQTRDFTFVQDVAMANFLALDAPLKYDIINIASGRNISINDLLALIFKVSQQETKIVYKPILNEESLHTHGDITRAKEILQYQPKVNLEEGLKMQWNWMNQ